MIATRHVTKLNDNSSAVPQRVLVVDDYQQGARTLSLPIEHYGHEVRQVFTGREALRVASEFRPTLILLDIALPDVDGYEVAKKLRKRYELGRTVIVALTGYGRELDRTLAKQSGCDHHITKPLELQRLLGLLATSPSPCFPPADAKGCSATSRESTRSLPRPNG
jgi:two-component system, sensor histidine kinase